MEIQFATLIHNTHSKVSPIVPLKLFIKHFSIKQESFYLFLIVVKFLPSLSISSTFNLSEPTNNNSITSYFRLFSIHGLIRRGLTSLQYFIGCAVCYLFQLGLMGYTIYYYIFFKRKKEEEKLFSLIYQILIDLHFVVSQFLIEYLSYAYYILGFKSFPIKNTFPYAGLIIILIANSVFIILINVHSVLVFQSINTPFNQNVYPMKMTLTKPKIALALLIENLSIFESFELYVTGKELNVYQIIVSVFLVIVLILIGLISLNKFNFDNAINTFIVFLLSLVFFSMIIEVIIYLCYGSTILIKTSTLIMIWAIKLISSFVLVLIFKTINKKILNYYSEAALFKVFDYKLHRKTMDVFLHLFTCLFNLQQGKASSHELLSLLINHKEKCCDDKCKCQLIQIFHYDIDLKKKEYTEMLVSRIGFLIETAFVQVDYSANFELSCLLAEYFFTFKYNPIMAYSIIQTFFHSNRRQMAIEQLLLIYSMSEKYITYCNKLKKKASCDFSKFYWTYASSKEVNKRIISFCESYNKMIELKQTFEGSIKVSQDYDNGEVNQITSAFLTSRTLDMIIEIIKRNLKGYLELIQTIIDSNPESMPLEQYFKINLFFNMFNSGKVPKKVKAVLDQYVCACLSYPGHYKQHEVIKDLISILYKKYDTELYSGNIIVKATNGFTIEYISEKLCIDLGFLQSTIIREDIEVLLPKEIRKAHRKAMVNFLIVNNNYNYFHSSYIFTAEGHSVPCTIRISALPGISKNLALVCNVQIRHFKSKYSFILDEEFKSFAISKSFDKSYSLTNELVNNFNIDMLKLFNIHIETLQKAFNEELQRIKEVQRLNEVSTAVTFSKRLFNSNVCSSDKEGHILKFKAIEEQKEGKAKQADFINSKKDIEAFHSKPKEKMEKKAVSFKLIRPKSTLIKNFVKIISNFNEIEVYDEKYKKLSETLYKLRLSMKNNCEVNKKTDNGNLKEEIAIHKNNYISYHDITVEMKAIYGQPVYFVKMIELFGNMPMPKNDKAKIKLSNVIQLITFGKRAKSSNMATTNDTKALVSTSVGREMPFNKNCFCTNFNGSTKINRSNDIKEIHKIASIRVKPPVTKDDSPSIQKKISTLLSQIHKSAYSRNKEIRKELEGKKTQYPSYKYLLIFMSLSLLLAFLLTGYNYFMQLNLLKVDHLLFQNLFSLYYQRDKYLHVYCLTLSLLYKVSTLSSSRAKTDNDLNDHYASLKESARALDSSYYIFYSTYLDYKEQANLPYEEMQIQKEFIQIKLNWIEIKYMSDYFSEMRLFTLLYNRVVLNREDISKLKEDVNQFLFDNFLLYPKKEVETDFARLLYYFGSNFVTSQEVLYEVLVAAISSAFNEHHSFSVGIIISIEVIILLIYLLFFGLVMYYLIKHNDLIFKSIIKMFIFSSPGNEYNSKHYYMNFSLRQKIKGLMNLTKDFNVDFLFNVLLGQKNRLTIANQDLLTHLNQIETRYRLSSRKVVKPNQNDISTISKYSQNSTIIDPSFSKCQPQNYKSTFHKHKNHTSTVNQSNSANTTTAYILSSSKLTSSVNSTSSSLTCDKVLTKSDFLKYSQNTGVQIIKSLALLVLCFCAIFVIFFSFNISSTFSYQKSIGEIFLDFSDFVNYYSLTYIYFNELRIKFISPTFVTSDRLLSNMTEKIDKVTRDITVLMHTRLNVFPETFELLERLNANKTSLTEKDISYFCIMDIHCIELYNSNSNELLSKGLNMGVGAMFLQMTNLYKDYVKAKYEIKTIEDIKALITRNYFFAIEQTLDFVLISIKDRIYAALVNDEEFIETKFKKEILIYTLVSLVFCILVSVVIMSVIIFNIERKIKFIIAGSYKFNQSFLYSYLVDAHNSGAN